MIMKHLKWAIGILTGAILGFGYWHFVGCNVGTCTITSSPVNSTIYGGLLGTLIVNSFFNKKIDGDEKSS